MADEVASARAVAGLIVPQPRDLSEQQCQKALPIPEARRQARCIVEEPRTGRYLRREDRPVDEGCAPGTSSPYAAKRCIGTTLHERVLDQQDSLRPARQRVKELPALPGILAAVGRSSLHDEAVLRDLPKAYRDLCKHLGFTAARRRDPVVGAMRAQGADQARGRVADAAGDQNRQPSSPRKLECSIGGGEDRVSRKRDHVQASRVGSGGYITQRQETGNCVDRRDVLVRERDGIGGHRAGCLRAA